MQQQHAGLWILQFLDHHGTNAASPLNMSCLRTIENALAGWRVILQVSGPLPEQDMELCTAEQVADQNQ